MSLLARRLTAQLLAGRPARDPLAVVDRLLAVQAQDPRGARLAIRARSRGVTVADIDRELTEQRSLLITWLHRGTLHLVASEDYFWLMTLLAAQSRTASTTRLAQEGIDAAKLARGLRVIERSLADRPLTRAQLAGRLQSAGIPTSGQATIQLLFRAAIEGLVVRGPIVGREHAYVLVCDWVAAPRPVARERALAELARRYLQGHGPATERDLARWAGIGLRDARAGLQAIASQLSQRPGGLVDLARRSRPARLPGPRLLGPFEPLLLGWTSRAEVLGDAEGRVVSGGIFRGFALVGGRAAAGWRIARDEVVIEPLRPLGAADAQALARDGQAILKFLAVG